MVILISAISVLLVGGLTYFGFTHSKRRQLKVAKRLRLAGVAKAQSFAVRQRFIPGNRPGWRTRVAVNHNTVTRLSDGRLHNTPHTMTRREAERRGLIIRKNGKIVGKAAGVWIEIPPHIPRHAVMGTPHPVEVDPSDNTKNRPQPQRTDGRG